MRGYGNDGVEGGERLYGSHSQCCDSSGLRRRFLFSQPLSEFYSAGGCLCRLVRDGNRSGFGTGMVFYHQSLDWAAITGIVMILGGVVFIKLFSKTM